MLVILLSFYSSDMSFLYFLFISQISRLLSLQGSWLSLLSYVNPHNDYNGILKGTDDLINIEYNYIICEKII